MSNAPHAAPKRTVIAAVPPPAHPGASTTGPVTHSDAAAEFQRTREARVGTHIAGTEGLNEPGSEQPRLRLMAGKVVPGTRYRILRWLGEGGMGVVYEAEHIDIERRVALKILRFDLSQQAKMAQVFRDEARAASRIGANNIVEIYDFGELQDGRLFFCMELLEGKDLVPETEESWIEPPRLIGLLRQICKGLGTAHKAGIVHRDIKPENVIVVTRGGREIVKLVDFGISAMLAAGPEGGSVAGTPHYMAPEQISGGAFDGRLDIYSVGCMAYELATGQPPFLGDELEELLRQHLTQAPAPMRQVRPDRDIPAPLEAVIMRCLAKRPEQRYADMADLEAALCEAQIAAKLSTPWDDLPLPEVDEQRREKLLRQMPSPLAEQTARRWVWPAVAGGSFLIAALALTFALTATEPTDQEQNAIDEIASSAQNAAARTHFVYPPVEDADAPTAFQKVLALESLEGSAADAGVERATGLRGQFGDTLVALGDKYWENAATRGVARDYYTQALLFREQDKTALERSGLTPGALAEFRAKASAGEFTEDERRGAQVLALLATDDQDERDRLAANLLADEDTIIGQSAAFAAARGAGVKLAGKPKPVAEPAPTPVPAVEPVPIEEPVLEEEPTGKKGRPKDEVLGSSRQDPKRAAELADEGAKALQAGRRGEAERLFNQAVAFDRRNGQALMGLSDVYFDTGENQKAVLYAERAVQAAPKNRTYRLKLGDAYYKVLRYRDALEQYQAAKERGESRADERIAKVKSKIG